MQKKPFPSILKPQINEKSLIEKGVEEVNLQSIAKYNNTYTTLMDQAKKPYFAPEANIKVLILEPYCASGNNWDGNELPGFEFND